MRTEKMKAAIIILLVLSFGLLPESFAMAQLNTQTKIEAGKSDKTKKVVKKKTKQPKKTKKIEKKKKQTIVKAKLKTTQSKKIKKKDVKHIEIKK